MNAADRDSVRRRAGHRCEDCGLRQEHYLVRSHQIEHIIPIKHGGSDALTNLALSCIRCNLGKGPNLSGIDSKTGEIVELFHPRRQIWAEHFALVGAEVVGLTPCGRATVSVLNMNEERRYRLRQALLEAGELDV